ncbi:hypothetical protein F5Y15DRAFT_417608 [Xylariaceae sp. FL0016]|nr:hypothetical protein F5Y15DRAFT_417608 [Xylariaceae sp. FL0016]
MSKRKVSHTERLSPPGTSPPSTTVANAVARPTTPSSAVQIPFKSTKQDVAHKHKTRHHAESQRRQHSTHRKSRDHHSSDAIPPSVATLLAMTSIPPPNRRRTLRHRSSRESSRMTVDSIVPRSKVSEKDLSQELRLDFDDELSVSSIERSPMDILLSPPEESDEEEASFVSESGFASTLSTRPPSLESVPSLGDSFSTSVYPSLDSPPNHRTRNLRPPRRSLEPVTSPPGEQPADPLSKRQSLEAEQMDFRVLDVMPVTAAEKQSQGLLPLKYAFKSNLTASLRALRSAAKTLSTFTASSVPPEDFLTRSILTMDPNVPFTDERRPPVLEEEPTEAMRRYLNPSTSSIRSDARPSSPVRSYTASIQMQTYKVQRSKGTSRASRQTVQSSSPNKPPHVVMFPPGPRQREMRENSDFIRIAVMEHLMRKRGKLDDQREGHARWLLPPRKAISKPYEIGPSGVPVRWVSVLQDDI